MMTNSLMIVTLIELLITRGPTLFIQIMKGLNTDKPTLAQIAELKVKSPAEIEAGVKALRDAEEGDNG